MQGLRVYQCISNKIRFNERKFTSNHFWSIESLVLASRHIPEPALVPIMQSSGYCLCLHHSGGQNHLSGNQTVNHLQTSEIGSENLIDQTAFETDTYRNCPPPLYTLLPLS